MSEAPVTPGKAPVWVVASMFVFAAVVFVAERYLENKAGDRVRDAVGKASAVRVNGEVVADPAILFATLKLVKHVVAHHSHPTTPIRIDLLNGSSATQITIARDSERPAEFWTYLPDSNRHRNKLGQEAGRITSKDLVDFLRKRGL